MRHVMMAAILASHLITIGVMTWVIHQIIPHWSSEQAMIWALTIFIAAWRAADDAGK